jgi:hypothetical protein
MKKSKSYEMLVQKLNRKLLIVMTGASSIFWGDGTWDEKNSITVENNYNGKGQTGKPKNIVPRTSQQMGRINHGY